MGLLTVVAISHGYFPRIGGAENQLRAFLPSLRKEGVETTVLTRRYDLNLLPFEKIEGFPVYRMPAVGPKAVASLLFTFTSLLRLLTLRPRPKLIHAHEFISPATVALLAGRILNIPIVATPHLTGERGDVQKMAKKFGGPARLRALVKHVSKFVVINDTFKEELMGAGVEEERIVYIPNGVDTKRFAVPDVELKFALRVEAGLPVDAQIAVFTGRFVPQKNLSMLLSAWDRYHRENLKAELLLVGEGEEEDHLRTMAGEGVHFMGGVADVLPYLQMADIFILPSFVEGLSVALLEAMSCGLVPLITDVGGAREVVTHDENGWLIPSNDGDALLAGLQVLFDDRQMLVERGQAARRRVVEKFSVQTAAKQLSSLYFDLTLRKKR